MDLGGQPASGAAQGVILGLGDPEFV